MRSFFLGRKRVGPESPTYFIADIGANHDGSLDRALQLIDLAAGAGADAAKFQNFRAETIVSDHGFRALGEQKSHQASWTKSVSEVYQDASLPLEWTAALHARCESNGIDYLTSPYDLSLLDALDAHVCAWKIGSGDITWPEAIARMSHYGKPLLIATGASTMAEVETAMQVALAGTEDVVLMQCNTNYTGDAANLQYVNLRVLGRYRTTYPDVVLGLSDHTPGHVAVLGAVALGARVIEKHFTDDTHRVGPDHGFALDPRTWREMVDRTRDLEAALGDSDKRVMPNEQETVVLQRRAIRTTAALTAGTVLRADDLCCLRPCPLDALPPYRMHDVVGRRLVRDLAREECVRIEDLA